MNDVSEVAGTLCRTGRKAELRVNESVADADAAGWLQIKISVSSVTDVVKMNTAMIIPNAVGIFTDSHKVPTASRLQLTAAALGETARRENELGSTRKT